MLAYGGTNNSPSGATSWVMNVGNACGSGTNTFEVQNHWNQNMVSYNFGTQNFNSSWHHWAVTTDSSGTRFYLDGILVSSSPIFISNINTINNRKIINVSVLITQIITLLRNGSYKRDSAAIYPKADHWFPFVIISNKI